MQSTESVKTVIIALNYKICPVSAILTGPNV